jgi:hypothetical protein
VEKAGRRRQQRGVTRQSLFGRWATTWRRTILPVRDTVDWPTAALVHTARCGVSLQFKIQLFASPLPRCLTVSEKAANNLLWAKESLICTCNRSTTSSP